MTQIANVQRQSFLYTVNTRLFRQIFNFYVRKLKPPCTEYITYLLTEKFKNLMIKYLYYSFFNNLYTRFSHSNANISQNIQLRIIKKVWNSKCVILIPLAPRWWGSSLPGLHTRYPPLSTPSTLAEIFRHKLCDRVWIL